MPGGTASSGGGGDVTTAELARATARIEHSLDALVVRVGDLATVVGALRGDLGRQ